MKKLLMVLLLISCQGAAEEFYGKVVGITDGDTLKLLVEQKELKIRLAEIDAPEKKQPFGEASKRSLSELAYDKEARADCPNKDRYHRYICHVYINYLDVGAEQVMRGMAWAYVQYLRDWHLSMAEANARNHHLGLWSEPNPVPPWEWRKERR